MTALTILNATLFDGTGTAPQQGRTVTIQDGRFASIDTRQPSRDEIVIDAEGRFALPGLINAHTHLGGIAFADADEMPAGEIAAWIFEHCRRVLDLGFTTCRETGALDGGVVRALDKGIAQGPRLFVAGPALVQMGGHVDFRPAFVPDPCQHHLGHPGLAQLTTICDGPDAVRAAARLAFKRGASFLKVMLSGGVTSHSDALSDTQFSLPELRAAVEEADARDTYVTGHTHNKAGIMRGLEAGIRCFEHASGLDEESALAIKAAGAAIVPTLTVAHVYSTFTHFLEPSVIDRVHGVEDAMRNAIRIGHEHGLLVGSGADLIGPDQKDYGLETALVAEVVGAHQALLTATRDNAKVLRVDRHLGTVERGKLADLVLVNGNPLEDPRLLADPSNIALVVKSGEIAKDLL